MEVSIAEQFFALFTSLIMGVIFGAIYDCVRILRIFLGTKYVFRFSEKIAQIKLPLIENPNTKKKEKKKKISKKLIFFLTDILYFFIITPIAVVFVYHVANGNMRWYIIFGFTIGFICYYFTVGKLVLFISEYITFTIKVIFKYLSFFLSRPFIPIGKLIKKRYDKIRKNIIAKREEKKKIEKEEKEKSSRVLLYSYGKK